MNKLTSFLSGKKGVIAAAIGLITTYLLAKNYIDSDMGVLITGLNALFFGVASYETKVSSLKSEIQTLKAKDSDII